MLSAEAIADLIKPDSATKCWLWIGSTHAGYGHLTVSGKTCGAHRFVYELFNGPIPRELHVDHLCRVRNCVNPAHLEAVTPRENAIRGIGLAAKNARATHCPAGHEYTPENTYRYRHGRYCKLCMKLNKRRYYAEGRPHALGLVRKKRARARRKAAE